MVKHLHALIQLNLCDPSENYHLVIKAELKLVVIAK
jgi:hypothetical protein